MRHIPLRTPCTYIIMHLGHLGMATMVNKKYTICDTCRLCHLILSILKPIFCQIQQIRCTHKLTQVPRSPGLAIFM